MTEDLTEDLLKMVALLTRYFSAHSRATLLCRLLRFFNNPSEYLNVCIDIHHRYATTVKSESITSFEKRFIDLLGLVEYFVVNGKWVLYLDA